MKQSAVACLSDNPYFSSFGKASVDNPIVTPEKISRSTATEMILNSISAGASVTKLSALEGTPGQKGFLQIVSKTATCAENKLIVCIFPYAGSTAVSQQVVVINLLSIRAKRLYWTHKAETWVTVFLVGFQNKESQRRFASECFSVKSFPLRDLSFGNKNISWST
jgi:hypothetical protein